MTSEGISAQDFLRFERKTQRARRFAIGDVKSIVFQQQDNPPWYQSTVETYDRLQADITAAEIEQCGDRIGREVAAWKEKMNYIRTRIAPISDLVPMKQLWCRDLWANQKE